MRYKSENKWKAVERLQNYVDGKEAGHRKSDIVKALALIKELKEETVRYARIAHSHLGTLSKQLKEGN